MERCEIILIDKATPVINKAIEKIYRVTLLYMARRILIKEAEIKAKAKIDRIFRIMFIVIGVLCGMLLTLNLIGIIE